MQRNVKLSQLYQNMKEAYDEIQTPLVPQMPTTFSKVSIIQELDATAYEEAPAIAFNMSFEVSSLNHTSLTLTNIRLRTHSLIG